MASTTLYRWHRRIGLAVFITIIAWAVSGLSHPVMSRLNPRPVAMQPPLSTAAIAELAPLSAALSANGIADFQQAQLLNIDDGSYYRVEHGPSTTYINARSGQRAGIDDSAYAAKLARHYLGDASSKITSVERISAFNEDYLYINRFLPVYKVSFERSDNMRVYVEVSTGRLASLIDDRKAFFGWVFRQLHSWVFITNPWLRTIAMSAMLLAGMGLSLLGLLMAWRGRSSNSAGHVASEQRPAASRSSLWHRRLGIAFGVVMLAFCFSGLYHLLSKPLIAPLERPAPSSTFTAEQVGLNWQAVAQASGGEYFRRGHWLAVDDVAHLRLTLAAPQVAAEHNNHAMEHHSNKPMAEGGGPVYINAQTSALCANCERRHALNLAAHYEGVASSGEQVDKITRFSSDYGFINKRMPVHAVRYGGDGARGVEAHSVFVETATGALAARTSPANKWEGWSFSYLHKWHFLDPISKTLRDILLIITTLALTALCVLGAWVSFKPDTRV
ncbi:hypothetical protein A9Q89_01030 [Gammaproteobacteria bacterium 53_120_T64]|nr:hypothetical protein A9Q89_01030 [Gammaproteobacteria bacterium 53_120_T64]